VCAPVSVAGVQAVTRADVVIVGGGLLGLSTAWALRGLRDVVVLEQATVGNDRAGSHGPTRIFRMGYVEPEFVAMAQRAAERWRVLESESGVQLLHPTPQLTFGPGAESVYAALSAAGVRAERITAGAIARRFPAFTGRGDAVLETTSAVIGADHALVALREQCGADVREHVRVVGVTTNRVETEHEVIDANAVVVCAGPWSRALVADIATTTTLEHAGYVRTGGGLPIFIDFTESAVYGLPTPGSDLYKLAVHHGGPVIDPAADFVPDPAAVTTLYRAIEHWLPGGEIVTVDVCPYDNTADERFLVQRVGGIVVGAGTSGHAFKFGPLLGDQLADLVLTGR
jgi:sarcosine oxidase